MFTPFVMLCLVSHLSQLYDHWDNGRTPDESEDESDDNVRSQLNENIHTY